MKKEDLIFERLKHNSGDLWKQYTQHKFVKEICKGELDIKVFKYYLIQDYIFLIEYSKAWSVAFQSADRREYMNFALSNMKSVCEVEIHLHLEYCKNWNISEEEILKVPVHRNTKSYTDYVTQVTKKYGYLGAIISMAPCCIGYSEIGTNIASSKKIKKNPFQSWIDMYSGEEATEVAENYKKHINEVFQENQSLDFDILQNIFNQATKLEVDFWDMPYTI